MQPKDMKNIDKMVRSETLLDIITVLINKNAVVFKNLKSELSSCLSEGCLAEIKQIAFNLLGKTLIIFFTPK